MRSSPALLALIALVGCGAAHPRPDLEAVAREIGSASPEHVEMAGRVRRSTSAARALVHLSSGAEVQLVEEDGALRIASGVLGASSTATPEEAIAALHRALNRELESGLDQVLAEPARSAWREERERYRDGTRFPEALECTVDEGHALATTPLGDEIELVREGNAWRVVGMHAHEAEAD
jgi:hypothetical protein